MAEERNAKFSQIKEWVTRYWNLQYIGVLVELWKIGKNTIWGLTNQGIYETLPSATPLPTNTPAATGTPHPAPTLAPITGSPNAETPSVPTLAPTPGE